MKNCKKCGNTIPKNIVVDGKKRNLQNRIYCFICSPYGNHNTIQLEQKPKRKTTINGIDYYTCSMCKQTLEVFNFYINNKGRVSSYCKKCANVLTAKKLINKKNKLSELFGNKCTICGYDKCRSALEFHHKNLNDKEYNISNKNYNIEKLIKEAEKCILLCANCHREIHDSLRNII